MSCLHALFYAETNHILFLCITIHQAIYIDIYWSVLYLYDLYYARIRIPLLHICIRMNLFYVWL